jgi:hypothetical protein
VPDLTSGTLQHKALAPREGFTLEGSLSRSFKRTPITTVLKCRPGTMKRFRAFEHRAFRTALRSREDADLIHPREYGNVWHGPGDGTRYHQRYHSVLRK